VVILVETDRDILLAIPSVRPSAFMSVCPMRLNDCIGIAYSLLDVLVGVSLRFFST